MRRRQLLAAAAGALAAACSSTVIPPRERPAPTALPALAANPGNAYWPPIVARAPAEIREAYAFAVANESTLRWIPCYCGCVSHGDRDNFDCYVDEIRSGGWLVLDDHGLT